MMRIFAAVALLALAGAALGGYSLGFKYTEIPGYDSFDGSAIMNDIYMLRFGAMVSPQFRMEGLLGYDKWKAEDDPGWWEMDLTTWALGGSGYYLVANPANTQFSIGGQVIYAKTTGETTVEEGAPDPMGDPPEFSSYSISPLMRIDFAIPGAEQFALFTEYGIRYYSVTQTEEMESGKVDHNISGYQTYAPSQVIAGAYYIF